MGDTDLELDPSTLPTLLLIVKLVGAPPDSVQASVEEPPEAIEFGVAVNVLITGAVTTGGAGVTVTVTDAVAFPALFDAVSM